MTHYKHTQFGRVIVYGMTGAMLVFGIGSWFLGSLRWMIPALVLLALIVVFFGTLTTQIRDGELLCRFGPGLFHKRFPLDHIVSAEPVRNSWIWGWGIRYTPHGWLYNVSGLDAVELTFADGKRARIGTDRPQELARAVRQAIEDPWHRAEGT